MPNQIPITFSASLEDLSAFPAYLRFSLDPSHYTGTLSFLDSNNNVLAHDLVSYDGSTGDLKVFVNVDLTTTETTIYCHYS